MKQHSRKKEMHQPEETKTGNERLNTPAAANQPSQSPTNSGPEVAPENDTGTHEISRAVEGRPGSFGIDDY